MSGPTYRETVYDGDQFGSERTRAIFVYLPTTVTPAGYVNEELIAGAVEHRRPDHDQLKALETHQETTARAWLAFIAGLAEMAVNTGHYALHHGPELTLLSV